MENTTLLLIGVGLLILAWIVYKKFVALPPRPTECETKCVDGVCFPSCNPKLSIGDHGSETMTQDAPADITTPAEHPSNKKTD